MTANEEKPKSRLSKIFTAVKRLAIICGSIIVIHCSMHSQLFRIIIGVFGVFILTLYFFLGKIKIISLIKRLLISVFILYNLFLLFIFISMNYYAKIGSRIAPNLTKEKILSLKLGMDKDEVITILGNPIQTDDGRLNLLSYLSGYFIKSEYIRDGYIIYADPGLFEEIGGTFEFTLGISNNKLSSINIERGDYGIYVCYKDHCPGIINLEALEELCSLSHR